MTNHERAAILMLSIDEEQAVEVMRNLNADEVRRLGLSMSRLRNISIGEVEAAARDFCNLAQDKGKRFLPVQNEMIEKIIVKAMGEERARKVLAVIDEENFSPYVNPVIEKLRGVDPKIILEFTKTEHPQTIALILAHLKPDQAAEVLEGYKPEKQADIVRRIATIKSVPQEFVEEMTKALESEIIMGSSAEESFGGVSLTAEIINRMGRKAEGPILNILDEQNPDLAIEIRNKMFTFEDIFSLDDASIREILKEVSGDDLARALKVVDPGMREKIYANMSRRASEMLEDDLEVMPPIRLSEVEQSQRQITEAARRLESEGRVRIAHGQEEDEFV
ncbi:MAG: flagellar motor switch protein FliG [Syntrophales bacterium]|nr:flagellar motor switch protein FliG [Syntrophales bacterium]